MQTIAIVGLGYVGLPLAHAFAKQGYTVIGYDVSEKRIISLRNGIDATHELSAQQLAEVSIEYTTNHESLRTAKYIIVALPTPVDDNNNPDLSIVISATTTIGKVLQPGTIVVYESTVYPGVTEEICGPILEQESGIRCGKDFFLGYSPERINPGDKVHTVCDIVKIVAGQNDEITSRLVELYSSIIRAGVHRAPNIKVAEMAKAIENAQRDLNIAFINEVAMLCGAIGISTNEVLKAAQTKWNFLPFTPGLVGGHCIGVDPYYLVEKAKLLGMETKVITAGRAVNDSMAAFVANQLQSLLPSATATVLVLGLTFKENVPDIRNSKSFDVIAELEKHGMTVEVLDPYFSAESITNMGFTAGTLEKTYDAVVLLVPHKEYTDQCTVIVRAVKDRGVLYDLKGVCDPQCATHCSYKSL